MQETTETQMEINAALVVRERYVCAGCWGQLNVYFSPLERTGRVTCDRCGDGRGFISKRFAARRQEQSRGEAIEVKELLRRMGLIPHVVRTAEEVLREIGVEA